jgi:hypothetical protein
MAANEGRHTHCGRITFQQHPSESVVTHTWLPGNYLFANTLWDLLIQQTPSTFWKAFRASLCPSEEVQLTSILKHNNKNEKFAMLVSSDAIMKTCVGYSLRNRNQNTPIGHLIFSFLENFLTKEPLLFGNTDIIGLLGENTATRCLMLLYTRIGHTLLIEGVDRAYIANVLDFAAQFIEPFSSDAAWRKTAEQVAAMLRSNTVHPVLLAHTNSDVGALDWRTCWCDDWVTTINIMSEYAPAEGAALANMSIDVRLHLNVSYYTSMLQRITPEERFNVCAAMQRSFGNAFRLSTKTSDVVFHVRQHVVSFDTLTEFCSVALERRE